jgi:hypothetical protein
MSIILSTWEVEIKRIEVRVHPMQKDCETPIAGNCSMQPVLPAMRGQDWEDCTSMPT